MTNSSQDATTTYYRTVPGVGAMRLAFAGLQRLWPALAMRVACRLFLTPMPPKWMVRGRAWSAAWDMRQLPFEQASITLYSQPGEGPLVLLVHGWGGHGRQLAPLAAAVAAAGMQPVILELPAHGRSAGSQTNLPQFARAIDYAVARLAENGRPVQALVAHSLGATAAAFAVSRNIPVARLVLVAPGASPAGFTRMFAQVFGLSERLRDAMQRRIEAREGTLMRNFEPAVLGARVAVPTLVVHDRGDTINPFSDGQAYRDSIAGAGMMATEGLGHRALLKDTQVATQVAAFVGQ